MRNEHKKQGIWARALIALALILLFAAQVSGVPMPQGIMGTVYELDGITQVIAGTRFSVNNTANGYYFEGGTGRGYDTGGYAVALTGSTGNTVVIRAWNTHNQSTRTVQLSGVMKNVNLLLDMSFENYPPEITSEPLTSVDEDTLYEYVVTAADSGGEPLTYSLLSSQFGMSIGSSSGLIQWLPGNDDVGFHTVRVMVSDGELNDTQTFSLEVVNVNDVPVITSSPVTTATEDVLYDYQVTAIDVDVGDTLLYALESAPAGMAINSSSGLITWLPGNGDVGLHNITVRAADGELADTQAYQLEVINVNDAPVIHSLAPEDAVEDIPYQYQVDATDVDSAILSYHLLQAPAGMNISSSGLITWLPSNADVGIHSITLEVSDADLTDEQSYLLTVENVNDAPYITSLAHTGAVQDQPYQYSITAVDIDNSQEELSYTLTEGPEGMTVNASGVIEWTPGNDDVGLHNITVRVSDGSLADEQEYVLWVENVNDAPEITSTPLETALEDEPYLYQVTAIDIDGDGLTYTLLNTSPDGMVIVTVNDTPGIVMWIPDNDDVGLHNVTIAVSDAGLTTLQQYVLTVINTNDAPVITSAPVTAVSAGSAYSYTVIAEDPDNDSLSYSLKKAPAGMTLSENTITWQPGQADRGSHQVTALVSDGNLSAMQTYVLSVTAGAGGGGGGGLGPGSSKRSGPVLRLFNGDAGALLSVNVSVTTTKAKGTAAIVKARKLTARPKHITRSITTPVYQYLEIEVQAVGNAEVEAGPADILFEVERSWLEQMGANPSSVVLLRFNSSAWEALPTTLVAEGEESITYLSESPSLSYFAISLESSLEFEQAVGEIEFTEPPVSSYRIAGVIYREDGSQVSKGTRFVLENLYLGEVVEGVTGAAGEPGSFSALIQAGLGDTLRLSVDENEHMWFVVSGDWEGLEMRTQMAKKGNAVTGLVTLLTSSAGLSSSFIPGALIIIVLISSGVLTTRRIIRKGWGKKR